MRRRRQREVWASLGQDDADWAVLTVRDRRHGRWEDQLAEFYASGRAAVQECVALAKPQQFAKALDFGAGTGRLSLALAARFESVTAVDVSPGMLRTIEVRAAEAGVRNISAVQIDDYQPQGDHDFAISLLVLQHLPSREDVRGAIRLIAASLRPGGVAVIELPERALLLRARLQPRLRVYSLLRGLGVSARRLHRHGFSGISMLTVTRNAASLTFKGAGLTVVDSVDRLDPDYNYVQWVVRKHA